MKTLLFALLIAIGLGSSAMAETAERHHDLSYRHHYSTHYYSGRHYWHGHWYGPGYYGPAVFVGSSYYWSGYAAPAPVVVYPRGGYWRHGRYWYHGHYWHR